MTRYSAIFKLPPNDDRRPTTDDRGPAADLYGGPSVAAQRPRPTTAEPQNREPRTVTVILSSRHRVILSPAHPFTLPAVNPSTIYFCV
ncbi:MAG: hypothetical protein ACJ8CR_00485 [Roseiflexaceae bacterium]